MFTKSFALTGVSAALLSLSLSHAAFASDEKIETVYVSATRSEGPQMPVATQITVIDSEQIRLSGATTITEILRTQAGIQIQDADGSGGRNVSVAMRGFSATAVNNTLVLVDGRKLNNPTLAGPALNTIALKDIERVEIIQGSAGVLYGDQAVGGVINVITHKAKQGELNGSVTAETGTANLENYAANVNQGFENGFNYSVSAQKRNADNFRDNNQSAATNLLGNIGFNFEGGNVFVEQQRIDDALRLPGALSDANAAIDPRKTTHPNDYSDQDTDLTRVGGAVTFINNWKFLGEYSDRDENSLSYFGYGAPTASNMRVKTITPRVVGSIATANGNAVVTVGYDKSESAYTTPDWGTDIEQTVDGYYGQVVYPVTTKATITTGVRHSSVDDTNNASHTNNSDSLNAAEIGINYQIDSAWRAFSRYAEGFRFANADENGFTLPGISFLNAQTSKSYEAGVAWEEKTASVKYSIYRMTINDEILYDSAVPNTNSFSGFGANVNLPNSERQGFLFDGEVQLSEQFTLHGNYTYTDAALTEGAFDGNKVPFVAKDTANVGLIFNFVKNVSAAFDANYVGPRFRVGDDANTARKVDAVTLFNFNILWDINDIELGFRIKNITSEKYTDYQGLYGQYPQPGRTYNAHVSYRF